MFLLLSGGQEFSHHGRVQVDDSTGSQLAIRLVNVGARPMEKSQGLIECATCLRLVILDVWELAQA